MTRAERRRQQREASKAKIPAPLNVCNFSMEQISATTGVRIESLKSYLSARENEMRLQLISEAQEKLCRAEDYIALGNILISLFAIKMTWGFTKANQRFMENINAATNYVHRIGIEEAYKQINKEMNIELEFDSMDLNKEFGFGGNGK